MERVTGYPSKMKEWIDIIVHWDINENANPPAMLGRIV